MSNKFINYELLKKFDKQLFLENEPCCWYNFHQFLTPEGFQQLYQDYPALDLFEKHEGIKRRDGQKPHDRYYLAYNISPYEGTRRGKAGEAAVQHQDLPKSWQLFVKELTTSRKYHNFIRSLFEVSDFTIRFDWHVATANCDVSPHLDSYRKIGSHLFYFNTNQDWNSDWGGATLLLSGKPEEVKNPDFSDFTSETQTQIIDNRSFMFRNTPTAWHGVKPLTCPEDKYRRLFNIIFEFPHLKSQSSQFYSNSTFSLPQKLVKKTFSLLKR